jgi:hypothetical protein
VRGRGARRVRPQERHPAVAHCTYARKLLMDRQCCDRDTYVAVLCAKHWPGF